MRRNIFKNSHYPYSLQCSCIPSPTYKHAYAYPSTILARRTPQTSVAADSREGSKDFKTRMLRVTHSRVWFNIIKTLIPNTQRVQQNVKRGDNIKRSLFLSITFPSPNLLLSLKVILIPNPKGSSRTFTCTQPVMILLLYHILWFHACKRRLYFGIHVVLFNRKRTSSLQNIAFQVMSFTNSPIARNHYPGRGGICGRCICYF